MAPEGKFPSHFGSQYENSLLFPKTITILNQNRGFEWRVYIAPSYQTLEAMADFWTNSFFQFSSNLDLFPHISALAEGKGCSYYGPDNAIDVYLQE